MNYLETIKNKFVEMNSLERIVTMFFINIIVFFMLSLHCFTFTAGWFKMLVLYSLGFAIISVLVIDLFLDKKHKAYKKLGIAVNIMAIFTIINTILQQLNINISNILETLNINGRIFDFQSFLNFRGTGSIITLVSDYCFIIFTVMLVIIAVTKIFIITNEQKTISLVHKFRTFFKVFKQLLTQKNYNYGFLYKRIP